MSQAIEGRRTAEPAGPAAAFVLTDDEVERLAGGKRAPVRVTIGEHTAELRLAVMGGCNMIGMSKAARADLGVEIGGEYDVRIELDTQPRVVDVPDELAAALRDSKPAAAAYDALAYTHRKEYAVWVGSAKKPETRLRRAAEAVAMLEAGRTRS